VALSGRITIDSSPDIRILLLRRLERDGVQHLVVDLEHVVYVDTSGLAILLEVLRSAREEGKSFHLSQVRDQPRYLLKATHLLDFFNEVVTQ